MTFLALLAAGDTQAPANPIAALLPFLLIGGLMYFLLIRPQKKRVNEQRSLIDSLEVGDEVLTIGGIYGTIRVIDDELDEITLEVAPGSTLRILPSAVARRIVEDEEWSEDDDETDEETDLAEGADGQSEIPDAPDEP